MSDVCNRLNPFCACDDCSRKRETESSLAGLRRLAVVSAPDPQIHIMRTTNAHGRIVDDVRPDQRD